MTRLRVASATVACHGLHCSIAAHGSTRTLPTLRQPPTVHDQPQQHDSSPVRCGPSPAGTGTPRTPSRRTQSPAVHHSTTTACHHTLRQCAAVRQRSRRRAVARAKRPQQRSVHVRKAALAPPLPPAFAPCKQSPAPDPLLGNSQPTCCTRRSFATMPSTQPQLSVCISPTAPLRVPAPVVPCPLFPAP